MDKVVGEISRPGDGAIRVEPFVAISQIREKCRGVP